MFRIISCKRIPSFRPWTRIRQVFSLFIFLGSMFLPYSSVGAAGASDDSSFLIDQVEFRGLRRTNPIWLKKFIGINFPTKMDSLAIAALQSKLWNTQVFLNVSAAVEPSSDGHEKLKLVVTLDEKWTTIPVFRGALGGGTPLVVVGAYDTHVGGQLWTLGAESRTYGSAAPGGVVWARAPQWLDGNHYINLELWRDNRIRSFYDENDRVIGSVYGSATTFALEGRVPVGQSDRWLIGMRGVWRRQSKVSPHHQEKKSVEDVETPEQLLQNADTLKKWQLKLVYDNLTAYQINLEGLRASLAWGPSWSKGRSANSMEQELFFYQLWPHDWNLSWHQWLGISDDRSYQSLFFLGGFDSIRGLPDGVLYGNRAFYANIEGRKLVYRLPYAWFQIASYLDYGSAAMSYRELSGNARASWGTGLRIAVPQVKRLMLRLDYAWSLDRSGSSNISIGMNQFIDPNRPL